MTRSSIGRGMGAMLDRMAKRVHTEQVTLEPGIERAEKFIQWISSQREFPAESTVNKHALMQKYTWKVCPVGRGLL